MKLLGGAAITILAITVGVATDRPLASNVAAQADATVSTTVITAANAFLARLTLEQRAKAAFPFDSPQKTNWSNLPSGIFERHSLRLGDMTAPQQDAAMTLLKAVLSRDGYQ